MATVNPNLSRVKTQPCCPSIISYLMKMVEELIEQDRKVLLFSQFTSMLDLIKNEVKKIGIPFVELRGDTKERLTPVSTFQNGDVPLFLISLKAGGTGLNLTAADTVIHYDPWWNPAVEDQATDRAHRIGQDKAVFVYRLVASGTIEQLMLDLKERKRSIAGSVLEASVAADRSMRFELSDLCEIFAPYGKD
jgi:SNF2 family DNA or RNA helicase